MLQHLIYCGHRLGLQDLFYHVAHQEVALQQGIKVAAVRHIQQSHRIPFLAHLRLRAVLRLGIQYLIVSCLDFLERPEEGETDGRGLVWFDLWNDAGLGVVMSAGLIGFAYALSTCYLCHCFSRSGGIAMRRRDRYSWSWSSRGP